jgi:hypothetical protein
MTSKKVIFSEHFENFHTSSRFQHLKQLTFFDNFYLAIIISLKCSYVRSCCNVMSRNIISFHFHEHVHSSAEFPSSYYLRIFATIHESEILETLVLFRLFHFRSFQQIAHFRKYSQYLKPSAVINFARMFRRMRWAGHVARMGEKRTAYRLLVGKPERKRPL